MCDRKTLFNKTEQTQLHLLKAAQELAWFGNMIAWRQVLATIERNIFDGNTEIRKLGSDVGVSEKLCARGFHWHRHDFRCRFGMPWLREERSSTTAIWKHTGFCSHGSSNAIVRMPDAVCCCAPDLVFV